MNIILFAAIGQKRELGLNNELLWKLPGDLPRFKEMTMGSTIIMGRKTFDSIGKPLPGRKNVVITRNEGLDIEGVTVVTSAKQALALVHSTTDVFVIGGGEIYNMFLPMADVLELTLVEDSPEADAFFPDYKDSTFKEVSRETNQANDLRYHYVRYERASRSNNSQSN